MAVAAEFDIHIDMNIVIYNILKCNLLEKERGGVKKKFYAQLAGWNINYK